MEKRKLSAARIRQDARKFKRAHNADPRNTPVTIQQAQEIKAKEHGWTSFAEANSNNRNKVVSGGSGASGSATDPGVRAILAFLQKAVEQQRRINACVRALEQAFGRPAERNADAHYWIRTGADALVEDLKMPLKHPGDTPEQFSDEAIDNALSKHFGQVIVDGPQREMARDLVRAINRRWDAEDAIEALMGGEEDGVESSEDVIKTLANQAAQVTETDALRYLRMCFGERADQIEGVSSEPIGAARDLMLTSEALSRVEALLAMDLIAPDPATPELREQADAMRQFPASALVLVTRLQALEEHGKLLRPDVFGPLNALYDLLKAGRYAVWSDIFRHAPAAGQTMKQLRDGVRALKRNMNEMSDIIEDLYLRPSSEVFRDKRDARGGDRV